MHQRLDTAFYLFCTAADKVERISVCDQMIRFSQPPLPNAVVYPFWKKSTTRAMATSQRQTTIVMTKVLPLMRPMTLVIAMSCST